MENGRDLDVAVDDAMAVDVVVADVEEADVEDLGD